MDLVVVHDMNISPREADFGSCKIDVTWKTHKTVRSRPVEGVWFEHLPYHARPLQPPEAGANTLGDPRLDKAFDSNIEMFQPVAKVRD